MFEEQNCCWRCSFFDLLTRVKKCVILILGKTQEESVIFFFEQRKDLHTHTENDDGTKIPPLNS